VGGLVTDIADPFHYRTKGNRNSQTKIHSSPRMGIFSNIRSIATTQEGEDKDAS
jgi:hypothetical protein